MKGTERTKAKTFQNKEKAKTNQPMNNVIQIEDRVSRKLPTDHDYAVPTREYQLDQSSPLPATAAADPVLEKTNKKTTPMIRRC
jgi:hypothetical protein